MTQYLPYNGTIKMSQARDQWNDGGGSDQLTKTSLGSKQVRALAGKTSGTIKMSDLYAKYRGWKCQFFSFPAESTYYQSAPEDPGGESTPSYSATGYGGAYVGTGAFRRQNVDCLVPRSYVKTYTLNLGGITPTKFGDITIQFIGNAAMYKIESGIHFNAKVRNLGFVGIKIDGRASPTIQEHKWYYGKRTSMAVTNNKYPTYISILFRRNGAEAKTWGESFKKWDSQTIIPVMAYYKAPNVDSYENTDTEITNIGLGDRGLTCSQAGQDGGDEMWIVWYSGSTESFNVGDKIEILEINYW